MMRTFSRFFDVDVFGVATWQKTWIYLPPCKLYERTPFTMLNSCIREWSIFTISYCYGADSSNH